MVLELDMFKATPPVVEELPPTENVLVPFSATACEQAVIPIAVAVPEYNTNKSDPIGKSDTFTLNIS